MGCQKKSSPVEFWYAYRPEVNLRDKANKEELRRLNGRRFFYLVSEVNYSEVNYRTPYVRRVVLFEVANSCTVIRVSCDIAPPTVQYNESEYIETETWKSTYSYLLTDASCMMRMRHDSYRIQQDSYRIQLPLKTSVLLNYS